MDKENSLSSTSEEALQHLDQALDYYDHKEFEKALETCDQTIQLDSNLADAHNLRGVLLEQLERREEAVEAYHEALRLDPQFEEVRENLQDLEADIQKEKFEAIGVEGKGFWIRTLAYIIDSFVLVIADYVAGLVAGLGIGIILIVITMLTGREYYYSDTGLTQCVAFIIGLILFVLYFAIFEWLYGATLGKIVLGMRVVQEDGRLCSFNKAFVRGLYRYIDGFFFGVVAYNHMKPPLQQRMGDQKVKTIVISSKAAVIQGSRQWWWFFLALGIYLVVATILTIPSLVVALQ